MKIVDEETGKIVSAAKWIVNREPLTEEQRNETIKVDWHVDPDDNAFCDHCMNWLHKRRVQVTEGKPCIILEICSTHPDYQRRGAGALHMKWGTELADSIGLKAYIEASGAGRFLYEQFGFVANPNDWIVVPASEKWRSRPDIKCYWLERPAKKL
ncbi:hypothetical protein F5884DRAFT_792397 [Xylogone sp. PMI_703]|nr:hypothetical protein F5884DRAFT_792397 [Xylogone sp. PMI_703]